MGNHFLSWWLWHLTRNRNCILNTHIFRGSTHLLPCGVMSRRKIVSLIDRFDIFGSICMNNNDILKKPLKLDYIKPNDTFYLHFRFKDETASFKCDVVGI